MRKVKDGWHKVLGYDVYVENGKVMRCLVSHSSGYRTAYPYRDEPYYNCMGICIGISLDALRAGLKRGTIRIM